MEHVALCRDEFDREQVVGSKPVLGHQPAEPAAERVARDARLGDRPSGHRQAVLGGSIVQLRPDHAAFGGGGCLVGIDRDRLHLGEVDHHAAVGHGAAGDVVAAAADRDLESCPARERERRDDVVRRPAADDHRGPAVDEAVVHGTCRLVARRPAGRGRTRRSAARSATSARSKVVIISCFLRIDGCRIDVEEADRVRTVATPLFFRSCVRGARSTR